MRGIARPRQRYLKALDQILDDAFVYVSDEGRLLTKAEVLKDVKESKVQRVVTESVAVHVHGETAIATGTFQDERSGARKIACTTRSFCRYVGAHERALGEHFEHWDTNRVEESSRARHKVNRVPKAFAVVRRIL